MPKNEFDVAQWSYGSKDLAFLTPQFAVLNPNLTPWFEPWGQNTQGSCQWSRAGSVTRNTHTSWKSWQTIHKNNDFHNIAHATPSGIHQM